jgi:N-acylneuraminate cytidylyltransferase
MKFLALIPARAGSKRVPNKNIRELGGKPLISWSIEVTRGIPEIVDVLVSTDSPDIAKIAVGNGALVPWLRPAELSTDTATSMAVCLHAVNWYENEKGPIDGLILLQPTSPFRTSESIRKGIAIFSKNSRKSVVSFSPAESHPMWCYRSEGNSMVPFVQDADRQVRAQDLPAAYVINGGLYIASPTYLRVNCSFIGDDTVPIIMESEQESLDIDTEWDWKLAETCAIFIGSRN